MYFERFYEGAAIQDPDNPGNDLEQIEDDVLDSHDEEVDDAVYGLPGEEEDPVEEACMAIYEAEYNTNMLYRSIGLYELNEASDTKFSDTKFGKKITAGLTDFKNNAMAIITKIFNKVKEIFYKFVAKLNLAQKQLKGYYDKYTKKNKDYFKDYYYLKDEQGNKKSVFIINKSTFDIAFKGAFKKIGDPVIASDASKTEKFGREYYQFNDRDFNEFATTEFNKQISDAFKAVTDTYNDAKKKINDIKSLDEAKKAQDNAKDVMSYNSVVFSTLIREVGRTMSTVLKVMRAYVKDKEGAEAESKKNEKGNGTKASNESFYFNY